MPEPPPNNTCRWIEQILTNMCELDTNAVHSIVPHVPGSMWILAATDRPIPAHGYTAEPNNVLEGAGKRITPTQSDTPIRELLHGAADPQLRHDGFQNQRTAYASVDTTFRHTTYNLPHRLGVGQRSRPRPVAARRRRPGRLFVFVSQASQDRTR